MVRPYEAQSKLVDMLIEEVNKAVNESKDFLTPIIKTSMLIGTQRGPMRLVAIQDDDPRALNNLAAMTGRSIVEPPE